MNDSGDQASVLIVDDEERVAETYALRLRDGYETEIALSGEEALQTIDERVDVVLLDRRMPGTTGDEVVERIRNRGLDCRIVMLTAVDPDFDITEMAIDDYVVKPVTKEALQQVVDRALTISEYNEQVQQLNSLKLKRNVLELELEEAALEENNQYQQLVSKIERLESEIESMEELLDIDQYELFL